MPRVSVRRSQHWLKHTLEALKCVGYAIVEEVLDDYFLEATRTALYKVQDQIISDIGFDRLQQAGELGVLRFMMRYDPPIPQWSGIVAEAFKVVEISVVIPVYGCADCLDALHQRLGTVLKSLVPSFEIIFIEDCGRDHSWDVLTEIARHDKTVKAYRLSRNFGQHAAITAGLAQTMGNWVIVMDCDLQDPPEEIPLLYERAIAGFDIVLARRIQRQHSLFKKITAKLYFRVLSFLSQTKLEGDYGTFSILSKKVVSAYLKMNDVNRHYLFILQWLGFKTTAIEYKHAKRYSGKSSYNLGKLLKHAFDGMLFQTTVLLKSIVYLGFMLAVSGILLAIYYIYQYLAHGSLPGWTSLSVLILLIGGFTIISTGITGLYIGKVFEQVKNRPHYVIDKQIVDGIEA